MMHLGLTVGELFLIHSGFVILGLVFSGNRCQCPINQHLRFEVDRINSPGRFC